MKEGNISNVALLQISDVLNIVQQLLTLYISLTAQMRKKVTCYAVLLGLVLITSCGEESSECTEAKQIAVDTGCYDPALGLTLVALNMSPDYKNLDWEIQVLSDLTTGLTSSDTQIIESGHETFTIPDSVLLDRIYVKARVRTNCGGWYLYSKYFSFIRIDAANCTVWEQNDI